jgi:hypothetical protein
VTHAADPRADAYIDALPDWQQAICREIRDLVHPDQPLHGAVHRTDTAAAVRLHRHDLPLRVACPQLRLLHVQGLPPFDFTLSSEDDGIEPHTSLRLTYPERLDRWKPLYKWFLAIPQYFVLAGLLIAACLGTIAGFFTVLLTGSYPQGIRDFLLSTYRYTLRVEAYVGFITDRYPPFSLAA